MALLEDVPPPEALRELAAAHLHQPGSSDLDRRRIDDLIVRIYWLMQEHHRQNAQSIPARRGQKLAD